MLIDMFNTNVGGVAMLVFSISTLLFLFLIWFGTILMFVDATAYWLVPVFVAALAITTVFYKKNNCKSLEYRDFVITLLIVILFLLCYEWRHKPVSFSLFWYLYLITFLSIALYAGSIRFKSLM